MFKEAVVTEISSMGAGVTSAECSEQDTVNVSKEEVSDWLYTPTDTVVISIIMPIIWCLGVISNLTFLFVMLRVPKLRTDTYVYLAHLALADLLYLNLAFAVNIWRYALSRVVFLEPFVNSAQCVGVHVVSDTGYFASFELVTAVSLERYLALCHPIKHLKIRGRRRTYRLIAICWLVGLLFAIAATALTSKHKELCLNWPDDEVYRDYPSKVGSCDIIAPWVNYTPPLGIVPWLFSVVANMYMYVRIFKTLNARSGSGSIGNKDPNALKIRNQVAKMLITNGTVSFLCQTPYCIVKLADRICFWAQIPNPLLGRHGIGIDRVPLYVNASINPLIYAAMTTAYRAAFREAFCCKKQPQRKAISSPLATKAPDQSNATAATSVTDENTETCETRL